jgi:hypothetical protein
MVGLIKLHKYEFNNLNSSPVIAIKSRRMIGVKCRVCRRIYMNKRDVLFSRC